MLQGQQREYIRSDIFSNEFSISAGWHMRGFQIGFTLAEILSHNRTRGFSFDFAELRSPKQRRIRQDIFGSAPRNGSSFVYGRQNNLYNLRFGYFEKRYFSERRNGQGMHLAYSYHAGLNLGMLKPYYLDLIYRNSFGAPDIRRESYADENRAKFLDPQQVDGASGFIYGWNELQFRPGAFAKFSLIVDFGEWKKELLSALEFGICADVFARKVPLLISQEESPIFINFYITGHLGSRWKK